MEIKHFFEQVISNFELSNLIFLGVLASVITFFFLYSWKNNFFFKKIATTYHGEQRVHQGEIPRLGGLMIYLSLVTFYLLIDEHNNEKYLNLLFLITPFMLISFVEDISNNISFSIRLAFMAFTALIINIYWVADFPVVENIIFISYLLEFHWFTIIFFSFAMVGIMNGANFIDGMNGLAALFFLGALCACVNLSFVANDAQAFLMLIPLIVLVIIFLLFNFPLGKLFLGDSGAYLLAILLSTWLIDFFSRHTEISSWNAVLIFIYPLIEVVYSVIRKSFLGKSPFYPDRHHIHIKIYDIILHGTKKPLYSNNVTTLFLAIFWLSPALMIQFVYSSQLGITACIIIITFIYIVLNLCTPSMKNLYSDNNKKT